MHSLLTSIRPFISCVLLSTIQGSFLVPVANASHLLPLPDPASISDAKQPQPGTLAKDASAAGALHIVALEGDRAVNSLKRKMTAKVVVEVLDGSNLPVAGALVTFSTPRSGASAVFADDLRTTTAVTDTAGKVAPPNITAVNLGSFNYEIRAMYREQEATTTVSQTNVANVASASDAQSSQAVPSGGTTGASAGTHRFPHWALAVIIGGAVAAAGVGVAVGSQQSGRTVATSPTATIGTGSGATASAPH